MQITSMKETEKIINSMVENCPTFKKNTKVFIAPSLPMLPLASKMLKNSPISLAAQNVGSIEKGAMTGETSILTLKELGVEYVIIGHSERRIIIGEKDSIINEKLKLVLSHGLTPVFCVGETAEERRKGKSIGVIYDQLSEGLKGITDISGLVIAYEPVWAINNTLLNPVGKITPASPEDAEAMHKSIRQWLLNKFGEDANNVPIIYGGSMNSTNAKELLAREEIQGGLIGSASLSSEKFFPIIKAQP